MSESTIQATFDEFDAAWCDDNYRKRASDGGVRETYYRGGFEAGYAAGSAWAADVIEEMRREQQDEDD